MHSDLITKASSLIAEIAQLPTEFDRLQHLANLIDHASAIVDDEPRDWLINLHGDLEGTLISMCDDVLESGNERLIDMMENNPGFQHAYKRRQEQIRKDAERDQKRKQWESFLLKRQVA